MTPRQQLVKEATSRLLLHNLKAKLGRPGYTRIEPKSRAMTELIEGVGQDLGGDAWEYYLQASDPVYYRLENEIYKNS